MRPLLQEIVSGLQHFVRLLLALKILSHQIVLHVGLGFSVIHFSFKFMHSSLQFLSLPFVAGNQVVESVLFSGVFGFKASHFLSVIASQFVNLFNERVDFLVFQGQLCI